MKKICNKCNFEKEENEFSISRNQYKECYKIYLKEWKKNNKDYWNNHGITSLNPKQTWQIDHIKPINTFNIISYDCEDFKTCWSLENLRSLDSYLNVRRPRNGLNMK